VSPGIIVTSLRMVAVGLIPMWIVPVVNVLALAETLSVNRAKRQWLPPWR